MFARTAIAALLAATALTACTAGPDYARPRIQAEAAAPFIGTDKSDAVTAAQPIAQWWRQYDDPLLDRLVADALAANTDIRIALARIEKARSSLRGAKSDRSPSTDLQGSATYGRVPESQAPAGVDREGRTVDAGISIGYEVDLFGRVRRGVEAARGDYEAAQADADATRLTIAADTVRAYFDATTASESAAVARRTVALLDDNMRITGARERRGLADRIDVIRVMQLRERQAADIPTYDAARDAALFRIATLTGRTPRQLPAELTGAVTTPALSSPLPVGDGQSLLARRPDIRAAERRLAADTARIGVATADLYPRITLGGSVGTTAVGATDIFSGGPFRWLLGPLISWAFPNQEAIRARIDSATADSHADLAAFDGAVLGALEETETALSAYRNAMRREVVLGQARDAAERAAKASRARQRVGEIDFLAVLDAERTLAAAQSDHIAARRATAFAQVDLFRALAGGWEAE
ncbi:NodT family efflux transporter outer membrane factor (OMF) lipoprotein [Sphingobium sp. OAS761]|uniref:efflux transporter outer membrane subunit n=1 Tax=Sphingobium sp. OAS761 TaxID=2817901 RepID=UPI00209EA4F4|nr:TolC family protein [Sphingobium sp. OAS761]MCP1469525.1 NodT family efflux transporter outer membrane factor (OMF) lipoprotein [Sphingobium sp. OAS761]